MIGLQDRPLAKHSGGNFFLEMISNFTLVFRISKKEKFPIECLARGLSRSPIISDCNAKRIKKIRPKLPELSPERRHHSLRKEKITSNNGRTHP